MKKISVIIPCYNVEKYIDRCIKSVLEQTIDHSVLEIILVNDASSDSTIDKLIEWEQKYPEQIMVINCEDNNGPGGARNIGIEYASAEYLFFVDADDWIEEDALEQLYRYTDRSLYDIVSGKMIFDSIDNINDMDSIRQYEEEYRCDSVYHATKLDGIYVWDQRNIKEGNVGGMPTVFGALYRRSIIVDNQLFFPEKVVYEDSYWRDIIKIYFSGMYVMDKVIYHYCYNGESITQKRNSVNIENRLLMELNTLEYYKRTGAYEYYKDDLEANFIRRFYLNTVFVMFTNFDHTPDIINYLRKTVLRIFPDHKKSYLMDKLNDREQMIIRLLEEDNDISADRMERIKTKYLEILRSE